MGIGGSVLKFVTPLDYPSSETGLAIGIWYIIGLVVLIYLYRAPSVPVAGTQAGIRRRGACRGPGGPELGARMREDEGYIDVPGGRVWYRSVGEGGTPLLCLHGGPGFTHYYLEALEVLADRRQVIFYDQLGLRQRRPAG